MNTLFSRIADDHNLFVSEDPCPEPKFESTCADSNYVVSGENDYELTFYHGINRLNGYFVVDENVEMHQGVYYGLRPVAAALVLLQTQTAAPAHTASPSDNLEKQYSLCTNSQGHREFFTERKGSCVQIKNEPGWFNLTAGPGYVFTYHPASIVRESDGVKVWIESHLATPEDASDWHTQYDHSKYVVKFFYASHQQLLIQGTYKLAGKVVHERLRNEAIKEEIEPGTVADWMFKFFCKGKEAATETYDSQFVCPESLPSEEARREHTKAFLLWVAQHRPEEATVQGIITYRMELLKSHHCEATLRNIRDKENN